MENLNLINRVIKRLYEFHDDDFGFSYEQSCIDALSTAYKLRNTVYCGF